MKKLLAVISAVSFFLSSSIFNNDSISMAASSDWGYLNETAITMYPECATYDRYSNSLSIDMTDKRWCVQIGDDIYYSEFGTAYHDESTSVLLTYPMTEVGTSVNMWIEDENGVKGNSFGATISECNLSWLWCDYDYTAYPKQTLGTVTANKYGQVPTKVTAIVGNNEYSADIDENGSFIIDYPYVNSGENINLTFSDNHGCKTESVKEIRNEYYGSVTESDFRINNTTVSCYTHGDWRACLQIGEQIYYGNYAEDGESTIIFPEQSSDVIGTFWFEGRNGSVSIKVDKKIYANDTPTENQQNTNVNEDSKEQNVADNNYANNTPTENQQNTNVNEDSKEQNVTNNNIRTTSIKTFTTKVNGSLNLLKYIHGRTGSEKNIKWTSSNKKVAKVNSKGKVTGLYLGTATLKATFTDTNQSLTWKLYVNEELTSELRVGDKVNLNFWTKYVGANSKRWKSNKKSVVNIVKGKVCAKKKGTATISCKYKGIAYKLTLKVKKKSSDSSNKNESNKNESNRNESNGKLKTLADLDKYVYNQVQKIYGENIKANGGYFTVKRIGTITEGIITWYRYYVTICYFIAPGYENKWTEIWRARSSGGVGLCGLDYRLV